MKPDCKCFRGEVGESMLSALGATVMNGAADCLDFMGFCPASHDYAMQQTVVGLLMLPEVIRVRTEGLVPDEHMPRIEAAARVMLAAMSEALEMRIAVGQKRLLERANRKVS